MGNALKVNVPMFLAIILMRPLSHGDVMQISWMMRISDKACIRTFIFSLYNFLMIYCTRIQSVRENEVHMSENY